jgi:NAD(P)-dependent dehydrogenase (short-subunit alcohol dehydrogenase family)
VVADLTAKEGVARVVAAAKEMASASAGGLWAVVNNAGLCLPGNVEWLLPESYEKTMALNFHAPVAVTYELLPLLKATQGRVINVTSVDGFIALPTNAAYNASKHALEAYSDSLRCEMKPWGVGVVVVEPATMRTPLAMSFADSWLQGFLNAPADRRAPYGSAWAERIAAGTKKGLEGLAADPAVTVKAMVRALVHPDPPTRMPTGNAAHYLFKPLSHLPDKTRDRLLYSMSFPGPPPAGLDGDKKSS